MMLKNPEQVLKNDFPIRRYSLSEIISESYKTFYDIDKGSNLQRLVETHIDDVRNHPTDVDRLSRQLSAIKEIRRLQESGQLDDADLEERESYHRPKLRRYNPPEHKPRYKESCEKESLEDTKELEEAENPELTEEELDELTKHLEEIRKKKPVNDCDDPKKSMGMNKVKDFGWKDNESEKLKKKVDESVKDGTVESEYIRRLGLKLTKFADQMDAKGIKSIYLDDEKPVGSSPYLVLHAYGYMDLDDPTIYLEDQGLKESSQQSSKPILKKQRHKTVKKTRSAILKENTKMKNSNSWNDINLYEFSKKSSGKAFYKTFKKLDSKLHEGIALTRQESINLYKAANSAMTHLSVELEHNPKFLSTFNESAELLSEDVTSILIALREGKAPSKKTMKSLAKFSDSLLKESENKMTPEEMKDYWNKNKKSDPVLTHYASYEEWYKDSKNSGYVDDTDYEIMDEAEDSKEEEPPDIEEEDAFVGDDEGEIVSEEEEEFNQEYADARTELHDKLVDKYEDTEDPRVQDKLSQDATEVAILNGEDPEAEDAEEPEEAPEGDEEPAEEEEESELADPEKSDDVDGDLTDEELAELKKYLTEMRKMKKGI